MNHYLPPQARIPAGMPYTDNAYRVQIWNPKIRSSPAPVTPSFYPRQSATPVPVQTTGNAESWRIISPPKPPFPGPKTSPRSNSPPSVKHLTCHFWAKNGVCKWNEEDCLYAHHHTGKIANGPLQVEPGREFPCNFNLAIEDFLWRVCSSEVVLQKIDSFLKDALPRRNAVLSLR